MNQTLSQRRWNLWFLFAYSVAMALLEAAVVVYMRRLYYPGNPLELFPLSFLNTYDPRLELAREIATIVMILTVALVAVRSNATKSFGAFVFVFGVWDLFYYFWLKVLMDWPRTWLEWDVLFLIPSVWLGPWICPALIALVFMIWGGWVLLTSRDVRFTRQSFGLFVAGAVLGLVTFLQPAAADSFAGNDLTEYVPGSFWWWLFLPSLLMMVGGFAMTFWSSQIPTRE